MNDKRYKWTLYTIVTVIGITIAIQVYWNYKNYQTNKQQLINDVQISLDKAVDDYYTALAEKTTFAFAFKDSPSQKTMKTFITSDSLSGFEFSQLDSIELNTIKSLTFIKSSNTDSIENRYNEFHKLTSNDSLETNFRHLELLQDSIQYKDINLLTTKVVLSINNDLLNIKKIDSLVDLELERKNISIDKSLSYLEDDSKLYQEIHHRIDTLMSDYTKPKKTYALSTTSKSSLLPKGSTLSISFDNITKTLLKRSLTGILISTLLVLAVISCLFYLLKIIKHQKQLAEVKNDLISNITHEFKTPIATIGVALESINSFNGIDDKEKTKKYISMSSEQLGKLNTMVEKLLETATLDSDNLELNKETINIVEMLNTLYNRYKIQFPDKVFNTSFKVEQLDAEVDIFHLENALNNILDNAVKYGGNIISIDLIPKKDMFDILISDNGNDLPKENRERIFEKFYRIPKGNTHDVKGFGIGLYYTKSIVEKHNGIVSLDLANNLTTFKITLPNG